MSWTSEATSAIVAEADLMSLAISKRKVVRVVPVWARARAPTIREKGSMVSVYKNLMVFEDYVLRFICRGTVNGELSSTPGGICGQGNYTPCLL